MSKVEVGDKVRVITEGCVAEADQDGLRVGERWFDYGGGLSVELVERRKPKVGDTIEIRDQLPALPPRAVVVNRWGHPITIGLGGTYSYIGEFTPFSRGTSNGPYTVAYIPD